MKKTFLQCPKFVLCFFVKFFFVGYAICQTPVFDHSKILNQTFTTNDTIFPLNGEILFGIGISGAIQFNSDTSLVRVLLADYSGMEFMIFETYPMLDSIWAFSFTSKCDET